MLIFDETSRPVILDSIYAPVLSEHFWVLDFNMMDFTVSPLLVLEETVCPSITIRVLGFSFILPVNWNILVYAEESQQLDVVEVSQLAGKEFTALVYGPNVPYHRAGRITVTDYHTSYKNVAPSLNKHQMLCHPIDSGLWVNVAPADAYNKFLKNASVGDIIE